MEPIGDSSFDDRFRVHGDVGDGARVMFTDPDFQAVLRHLDGTCHHFRISDQALKIGIDGYVDGAHRLISVVHSLVEASNSIDDWDSR